MNIVSSCVMKKGKPSSPDLSLHQEVAQLLSAYLDGQVDDRERYWVERHLSSCPVCRRDLESLRHVVRLLNQLPAVTPPHPFTLRPEWVTPARPSPWRWLFGMPGLATGLAALMCLFVLAGALLYNRLTSYRAVMPLARVPITHVIPTAPTTTPSPTAARTVTLVVPSPAMAHGVLSPPAEPSPSAPTLTPSIPSRPSEPLAASPIPLPEARGEEYGEAPPPTPLVIQPEQESVAEIWLSPQQTEVPSAAHVAEEMSPQHLEDIASPEPTWTVPPAVGVMVASAATETPTTQLPSEKVVTPSEPSHITGAIVPPAAEISAVPSPSEEKATLPPALSKAGKTSVMPAEAPVAPSPAPVQSAEPSPAAEAMAVPADTETPTPLPSVEATVVSAEPSPAAEAMAVPAGTEMPTLPAEISPTSPAEEFLTSTADEVAPVTPAVVEPKTTDAPGAGPTEVVPTPTRVLIPVRDLRLTIKPGRIRIEGALPLPPGQPIQAELWCEGELVEWAIPETQRGKIQQEGRFELELQAQPNHPGFDLFQAPPARYEVRIVPLDFEAPVEARIPFDTFPPATKQP
ncbi:MAG: zf-HC2 domain-containing protein [Anaerolineae bacterium]|nr:zf-HC2 domain-containing protein [Anaerolineae bacterium]MDW8070421.1 zf-HC2 domain-containing protein [Anaerolineae bacterium]